ncbi:Ferritin superfamily protein [Halanaeroarchaeum sp. HSR-CO]|nr:Ferritin superfamily protein [Halanaeroarchaeum sp. HSR-CO]
MLDVSTTPVVESDDHLARLLQIAVVLEEVVEARAYEQYRRLPEAERDAAIESLLESVSAESAQHRERIEGLIEELDASSVAFDEIEALVGEQYAKTSAADFDGVLYDQLHGEESAYKFYDDLISAIEESEKQFSIERDRLLAVLRDIRKDEAEGVAAIANLMGERT